VIKLSKAFPWLVVFPSHSITKRSKDWCLLSRFFLPVQQIWILSISDFLIKYLGGGKQHCFLALERGRAKTIVILSEIMVELFEKGRTMASCPDTCISLISHSWICQRVWEHVNLSNDYLFQTLFQRILGQCEFWLWFVFGELNMKNSMKNWRFQHTFKFNNEPLFFSMFWKLTKLWLQWLHPYVTHFWQYFNTALSVWKIEMCLAGLYISKIYLNFTI
jgi:hypothetical protein